MNNSLSRLRASVVLLFGCIVVLLANDLQAQRKQAEKLGSHQTSDSIKLAKMPPNAVRAPKVETQTDSPAQLQRNSIPNRPISKAATQPSFSKTPDKVDWDDIADIVNALVSIVALIYSVTSFRSSVRQTTLLNQSYLDAKFRIGINPASAVADGTELTFYPDLEMAGISAYIDIMNAGNVPARYQVTRSVFLVQGEPVDVLDINRDITTGLIFPKKELTYNTGLLNFAQITTLEDLGPIEFSFRAEYQDFGRGPAKVIDRTVRFVYHHPLMHTRDVSFDDAF